MVVFVFVFCGYIFGEDTNEVILPQTEFFTEGAVSPVFEKRDVNVPSKEQKKSVYEYRSIKDFKMLEEEAQREFSREIRSKILSFFSYGMNDILNFSVVGFSQVPVENIGVSAVVKFSRFKRSDVVFYYDVPVFYLNTFRDLDLAGVSVGVSSSYVFWNVVFDFYEEFRGLWNNSNYVDEKSRTVSFDSKLRYRIDKDSSFNFVLNLNHYFGNIRNKSFYSYQTSFNDFYLNLGYVYGIEGFNFFSMGVGLGANVVGFTDVKTFSNGVYGDVSFSFMFPVYANTWLFGLDVGIVPDTFLPMEWFSKVSLGYKFSDSFITFLSIFKDYTRFNVNFLNNGLNFMYSLPLGDSVVGVELNSKLFFLGNSLLNLFLGYSYYLNKVFDDYLGGVYVLNSTNNVNALYSKVILDVISFDWFNFEGKYVFSLFLPMIPYVSIHSVGVSSKFLFGSFTLSLGASGESVKSSKFGNEDILPYLIVYLEIEWEVIKNISITLKADNVLNNLIEVRKDSVISEPFYISGGLKVKL